jgi:hypothetical protein
VARWHGVLSECQDQAIVVSDHEFALSVNSLFGSLKDIGAARAQLLRQRVDPYHAEVGVPVRRSAQPAMEENGFGHLRRGQPDVPVGQG